MFPPIEQRRVFDSLSLDPQPIQLPIRGMYILWLVETRDNSFTDHKEKDERKQWSFGGGMESMENKSTHPKFLPKSLIPKELAAQILSVANLHL